MGLTKLTVAALTLAVCGFASQGQLPLQPHKSKGLVNSAELQALIEQKNLFRRAEDLFHIAESSIEEYGHPTRVIGSQGMHVASN